MEWIKVNVVDETELFMKNMGNKNSKNSSTFENTTPWAK